MKYELLEQVEKFNLISKSMTKLDDMDKVDSSIKNEIAGEFLFEENRKLSEFAKLESIGVEVLPIKPYSLKYKITFSIFDVEGSWRYNFYALWDENGKYLDGFIDN